MKNSKTYYNDWRLRNVCAYCGGYAETEDHVPSKCFLDKPLPQDPPVVPCCHQCNASFTGDEEYVFCLIECMKAGTTNPMLLERSKARKTLQHSQGLRIRLTNQYQDFGGVKVWNYERKRVERIIRKLAFGHLAFENETLLFNAEFNILKCQILSNMSTKERDSFEMPYIDTLLPEVGSRALENCVLISGSTNFSPWQIVQPQRYRYCTSAEGHKVKFVIAEYLAIEVEVPECIQCHERIGYGI